MLRDFTAERFDIIIQAGQSNADGTGFGPTADPWVPTEDVWYLNGDFTVTLATEAVNGNEIQSNFSLFHVFCHVVVLMTRIASSHDLHRNTPL